MNDLNDKCPWPHVVLSPICVYDRDSFDEYRTGEYEVPKRCICGARLVYEKPVVICLVEHGKMTGEMQLEMKYPLTRLQSDYIEEYAEDAERRYERMADTYNKNSGPKQGVAGEIEAQRWSEDLEQVKRSMELAMWANEGETYEEMMGRRRAAAPVPGKDRVLLAIDKLRECARSVTPDPDPKESARLAYYDAEQILRGAFGLELEFGTDEGWPPPSVSRGCSVPKVVCPTCKQEAPLPDIQAAADACFFCGEDHTYRECPEYSEHKDEVLKADLDKDDNGKAE